VSLVDAAGQAVFSGRAPLTTTLFGKLRASDCSFDLPLSGLRAGQYLVSVTVTSGKDQVQRAVKFSVP
jgi:hypothetical protein